MTPLFSNFKRILTFCIILVLYTVTGQSSLAKERNKGLQWAKTMEQAKMVEGLSGDLDKYTQRTFDYTAGDAFGDLVSSKGEEAVFRFEHGEEAFVGTIGSLTLKGASKIVSTMPFGFGDETATTLDNASYHLLEHAVTHGFGLIEPEYRPTEGSIVQASFKGPVKDSYTSEHASSLLSIGTIGLGSTLKGATKLGKIVPKAFKSKAFVKEPDIIGLDSSHLYGAKVRNTGSSDILVFERTESGALKIKNDPLAGTKKETLDVKYKDKQFYEQLKDAEKIRNNAKEPNPDKTSHKTLEVIRNILRAVNKIGGDG